MVGVVLRPMVFDPTRLGNHSSWISSIRSEFEDAGLPIVDTTPAFTMDERERDWIIFPGDPHPNAAAHGRFAEWIAPRVEPWLVQDSR